MDHSFVRAVLSVLCLCCRLSIAAIFLCAILASLQSTPHRLVAAHSECGVV